MTEPETQNAQPQAVPPQAAQPQPVQPQTAQAQPTQPQPVPVQPQATAHAVATEAPPELPSSAASGVGTTPDATATGATVQSRAAMLPEAPPQEPPRPLVAGAFLRQEFEIKDLLSRGMTNIYAAQSGDYGATAAKLIAERDVPRPQPLPEPSATPVASTQSDLTTHEVAQSGLISNADASNAADPATSVEDAAGSGAFVEDVDTLSSAPLSQDDAASAPSIDASSETSSVAPSDTGGASSSSAASGSGAVSVVAPIAAVAEKPVTDKASTGEASTGKGASDLGTLQLLSPLFPPREAFAQDEREYLVFDYFESESLQDYREPTNDDRLLSMLSTLANGLRELEEKNLRAQLTTETLRVADSKLFYLGFVQPQPPNQAGNSLEQLREITSFLLKRVFAESTTMRLDDEYGSLPLSEELKEVARRINENEFGTVAEAAQAINSLCASTRLHVEAALLSDVGRERELNEDSGMIVRMQRSAHLDSRELELYVVADGMGGHEGGEVASDLTLTSLQKHIEGHAHIDWNDNVAVKAALVSVIDAVNADVVALTETPKYKGTRAKPGSTLTFALRLGARVFIGNVGDSRAYKYSGGVLTRISKDHSYVQTLLDRGEITEEEAFDHPEGSVITAHIGYPKLRLRDVFLRLFAPGDKLLLVSDGVTDMLRDAEYEPHIQHEDPADVCRALVDASNAAGGADNITVVCVQFS